MFRLLYKAIFKLQLRRRFDIQLAMYLYILRTLLIVYQNAFWVAAWRWFYKEAETCR